MLQLLLITNFTNHIVHHDVSNINNNTGITECIILDAEISSLATQSRLMLCHLWLRWRCLEYCSISNDTMKRSRSLLFDCCIVGLLLLYVRCSISTVFSWKIHFHPSTFEGNDNVFSGKHVILALIIFWGIHWQHSIFKGWC